MTKQELLELIKEAKELGLTEITVGDIHMKFNSESKSPFKKNEMTPEDEPNANDLVVPLSKWDELTDDEILYWSSDYGKELEEQRLKEKAEEAKRLSREDTYT